MVDSAIYWLFVGECLSRFYVKPEKRNPQFQTKINWLSSYLVRRSGMFWTVRGANAIIALRCAQISGKFEALPLMVPDG
jgi:hypothetical protein